MRNRIQDISMETLSVPPSCLVDSLEDAINIVNKNKYGNGASIFTTSGVVAWKFQTEIEAGQVGINVSIPVPLPFILIYWLEGIFCWRSQFLW
ncbi:methylmalonate-semialdehyde dehydrogenase [acylating], mitochondrial-like [Actinidia eriantha]|uniref:methylmalonate-semialdehyde dehydrogenase [acylating], mitochondrial-like n=1 Tax=Actinidia eriantha TaxID=165200 RepID=UPI00259017E9|nr:methylmalonate-semialdehyde dehydrogenase [acylating], mitochondrial-like [Actinidia eriantha]